MTDEIQKSTYNRYVLAFGTILIIAIIGVIISIIFTFTRTSADEENISTLRGELVALKNQLSTTQDELDSLVSQIGESEGQVASINDQQAIDIAIIEDELAAATDNISSATDNISLLNNQMSIVLSQISSLQAEAISDNSQISSIETKLTSITSQLSSLSSTADSLQSSLTSLEQTVDTLSSIVNSLKYPLLNPVAIFTSKSISQAAGGQTLLSNLTATYSGYINISGNSSSSMGYIRITDNSTSASQTYAFGTVNTLTISVTAGHYYSLFFGNTEVSGTVSAILTGIYYY